MSSRVTQVGKRSECDVKNVQGRAIASSAANFKNGESTLEFPVVIDIHEKDSQPAAPPAPPSPPLAPPVRTPDRKLCHSSFKPPLFSNGYLETEREEREYTRDEIHAEGMDHSMRSIRKEKFRSLHEALVMEERRQPKIQKVPFILLRDNNNFRKYYEPRIVSIGPYHHGNSNLKETEKMKLRFAAQFIEKHNLSEEKLYSKIKGKIKDMREFYEEKAIERFNDDDLAWMFLVDGCTILHYIHCATIHETVTESLNELRIKVDCLTLVQQDLFLLENQLPYQVLESLMKCLEGEKGREMKKTIEKFIFERIKAPKEKYDEHQECQNKSYQPIHLLDLLRTRLLQSVKEDHVSCSNVQQLIRNVVDFISEPLDKFQDLIEYMGKAFEDSSSSTNESQDLHFFRNVKELKAVGIRLKASKTSRLTDITFNLGTLKLPPFRVDELTASKLLNLIAYEMCPDFVNDFGVCSYIVFLDAFIDRAQDVKQLRDKQILHNALGSDEEVAKLFNVISTNLVSNHEKYLDVKSAIQKRYDNKVVTWIAQFHHKHFESPWSMLAFLAAIIALTSSVIQSTYTVLGYYRR